MRPLLAARRAVRRLGRDEMGVALIEFAIVAPVLLTLYLSGFQLMDAIACNRKVAVTARATADLISQYAQVQKNDVATILSASTQIMYPENPADASIRVSEIVIDAAGTSTIAWSRSLRGTAYAPGTPFAVPASIKVKNSALVYAEVSYPYSPLISFFNVVGAQTFTQNVYMVPRKSNSVDCTDCS